MIKESLVLVTLDADGSHKPYIFRCPKYALHVEDKVIVETCKGEVNGKVVGVLDYVTDEARQFLLDMEEIDEITGIVTAKYKKEEFKYE